jgi:hypothetical protein
MALDLNQWRVPVNTAVETWRCMKWRKVSRLVEQLLVYQEELCPLCMLSVPRVFD